VASAGHMQIICTLSSQITTLVPDHSVFTGRMPFLPHKQQRQSTVGILKKVLSILHNTHTQRFHSSLDCVQDNLGELVPEGIFCHLLDFLVQNEDNRQTHQQSGWTATPSRLIGAPICIIPTIFTPNALPGTTLPIYPGLGEAPNMLACTPVACQYYQEEYYIAILMTVFA